MCGVPIDGLFQPPSPPPEMAIHAHCDAPDLVDLHCFSAQGTMLTKHALTSSTPTARTINGGILRDYTAIHAWHTACGEPPPPPPTPATIHAHRDRGTSIAKVVMPLWDAACGV